MTPDDLIASDPPPAFPPWMVAADPRLAAQETNRIYQAFRRRRVLHGRGDTLAGGVRRSMSRGRSTAALVMTGGASTAMVVLLVILFGGFGCLAGLVLIVIGWLASALRRRSTRLFDDSVKGGRLPMRLMQGFPVGGYDPSPPALEACWTVGATGREVAEAIYLELRERDVWLAWFVALVLATPSMVYFAVGAYWQFASLEYWASAVPATLWLIPCALIGWRGAIYQRPQQHMRKLVRGWQRSYPRFRGVGGPLAQYFALDIGYAKPRAFFGLAITTAVLLVGCFAIGAGGAAGESLIGKGGGAAGATMVGAVLAVAFFWGALAWSRWDNDRQLVLLIDQQADEAFTVMAGRCASGDDADDLRAVCIKRRLVGVEDRWAPTPGMMTLLGPQSLLLPTNYPQPPRNASPPPPPPVFADDFLVGPPTAPPPTTPPPPPPPG